MLGARERTNIKLNPHNMASTPGFKPGPHWVGGGRSRHRANVAPTLSPPLLPSLLRGWSDISRDQTITNTHSPPTSCYTYLVPLIHLEQPNLLGEAVLTQSFRIASQIFGSLERKLDDSDDDGARRSKNQLYQWRNGKVNTGSRVKSFPRARLSRSHLTLRCLCKIRHPKYFN